MATLVQSDLEELGMRVTITALESRATIDRVLNTKDYDAAIFGLVSGDADPNGDMDVWLSSGATHLWRRSAEGPATPWEAEIDDLLRRQVSAATPAERRRLYDRVQVLLAEYEPVVFLASPHVLAAARRGLRNFKPAVLPHYILWNADLLHWSADSNVMR
jgi:peptide/nickel transport system substrate-binding protein